jgi:hypothetical protein
VIAKYNSIATVVAISSLDADEELKKNIDNELKRVEEESKRPQVLEKYEEEFSVGHTAWHDYASLLATGSIKVFVRCRLAPHHLRVSVLLHLHNSIIKKSTCQMRSSCRAFMKS